MTVRVLVADDQDLVRTGLSMILDAQPDIGSSAKPRTNDSGRAWRGGCALTCLVDIRTLPGLDGLEVMALLAGRDVLDPMMAVVVITTFDLDEYVHGALRAGARRFLPEGCRARNSWCRPSTPPPTAMPSRSRRMSLVDCWRRSPRRSGAETGNTQPIAR